MKLLRRNTLCSITVLAPTVHFVAEEASVAQLETTVITLDVKAVSSFPRRDNLSTSVPNFGARILNDDTVTFLKMRGGCIVDSIMNLLFLLATVMNNAVDVNTELSLGKGWQVAPWVTSKEEGGRAESIRSRSGPPGRQCPLVLLSHLQSLLEQMLRCLHGIFS